MLSAVRVSVSAPLLCQKKRKIKNERPENGLTLFEELTEVSVDAENASKGINPPGLVFPKVIHPQAHTEVMAALPAVSFFLC